MPEVFSTAHNTLNEDALMFPYVSGRYGWHYEDFLCLNKLYGPMEFVFKDYLDNVIIPQAKDDIGNSGWAVLQSGSFSILDYGVE